MPELSISTRFFANVWRDDPALVAVRRNGQTWDYDAEWVEEALEFCQSTFAELPPVHYWVELSNQPDGSGISGWIESVIANFATDADLVAFRLRFPDV